jgi:hypothetical protein
MSGRGKMSIETSIQKWRPGLRIFLANQSSFVKASHIIDAWLAFSPGFYPGRPRKAQIQILGILLGMELPVRSYNSGRGKTHQNILRGIEVKS